MFNSWEWTKLFRQGDKHPDSDVSVFPYWAIVPRDYYRSLRWTGITKSGFLSFQNHGEWSL